MEKWIICDIDGTLLNNHVITEYTKKVLIEAQQQGYRLFLASGRSPYTMKYFVESLKLHEFGVIGICFNGGIIYNFKENEVISSDYIDKTKLKHFIKISEQAGLEVAVYSYDKVYVKKCNPKLTAGHYRDDEVYKYVQYLEVEDLKKLDLEAQKLACVIYSEEQYVALKSIVDEVGYIRVHSGWMERSGDHSDKGSAIQKLMKTFNQSKENIYCFGDGENDITMFKVCGHPIAMQNAFDSLKNYAEAITDSNLEDGVAKYVEKHLLK